MTRLKTKLSAVMYFDVMDALNFTVKVVVISLNDQLLHSDVNSFIWPDMEGSFQRKHCSSKSDKKSELWDKNSALRDIMNLNVKNYVLISFRGCNKIPSDVPSCLFCALSSKYEKMIGSWAAWTEALQQGVSDSVPGGPEPCRFLFQPCSKTHTMQFSNKPEGLDQLDQVCLIRVESKLYRAPALQELSLTLLLYRNLHDTLKSHKTLFTVSFL